MTERESVILTLPSKGTLDEPTVQFMTECGLRPVRTSPREYGAHIPAIPGLDVLFQRTQDIAPKVSDGTADMGITGLDIVRESGSEGGSVLVLHEGLGYGLCDLVIAVPETWVDVDCLADLADVALDYREARGRDIRVATKFPNLVREYLLENGVTRFAIVAAHGAIEAAPAMGYADIVADLSTTGTTLRANHLKPLEDGLILQSQACLIANTRALRERKPALDAARALLERIDATLQGREYNMLVALVRGSSAANIRDGIVGAKIIETMDELCITDAHAPGDTSAAAATPFSVTITVHKRQLLNAVACLRGYGATRITVTPVRYRFGGTSPSYARMMSSLHQS